LCPLLDKIYFGNYYLTRSEYEIIAMKGLIHSIQHYSIQDGPGIRSTIFFKGCPLRCLWCANPDTQKFFPELTFDPFLCPPECKECLKVCSLKALFLNEKGSVDFCKEKCNLCEQCLQACYSKALKKVGTYMGVEQILEEVERERPFYETSGGGVTISGGEPLMQGDFLIELIKSLKEKNINVALDTSGYGPWSLLKELANQVDWFLYDIKHMDSIKHKDLTGQDNKLILENLKNLIKLNSNVVIRFPLIPGYNDEPLNLVSLGEFIKNKSFLRLEILPYHRLGASKYKLFGLIFPLSHLSPPSRERMQELERWFRRMGVACKVVW